jgi:hypothetical protein
MRLLTMTIELNTVLPLTPEERHELAERVGAWIRRGHAEGAFAFWDAEGRGQALKSCLVHPLVLDTPTDGTEAHAKGFWRRHNPYEPGTPEHADWNVRWDRYRHWPPFVP